MSDDRTPHPLADVVNEVAATTDTEHAWPATLLLASGTIVTGWAYPGAATAATFVLRVSRHPDDEAPPRHLLASHVVGAWWAEQQERDRLTGRKW